MSDPNIMNEANEHTPVRIPWLSLVLGAGLAGALGLGFYQHSQVAAMQMQIGAMEREMTSLRQVVLAGDGSVNEKVSVLQQELEAARKETVQTSEATRKAAESAASRQARLVAAQLNKRQEEQGRQIEAKLSEIKSSSDQNMARLSEVSTEVGTVKTDVATTRTELERVAADLHRTTGDMGIMSGLIATNSKELSALRELGERDYLEFRIGKTKDLYRIGDVSVRLKKADAKRNRFSLELVADDKRVEKKDRNVNEPVQFYVLSKARQPYEMVVNEVRKDEIVGYLAVPKLKLAARK